MGGGGVLTELKIVKFLLKLKLDNMKVATKLFQVLSNQLSVS